MGKHIAKRVMKKGVFFSLLISIFFIVACGGGSGGGTPITYKDGTSNKTVRILQAGDYAYFTFTGSLTLVSSGSPMSWTGSIRYVVLASTTTIGSTTVNIARVTSIQSLDGGSPITSITDRYFLQDSSGMYRYGEYSYDDTAEYTITSPAIGFVKTFPETIDVGTVFSYNYTKSNGETDTGLFNVVGTENITVPIGSYSTYKASGSSTSTKNSLNYTNTSYIVPSFGSSIKSVEQGSMTISGDLYSYEGTLVLAETNISF